MANPLLVLPPVIANVRVSKASMSVAMTVPTVVPFALFSLMANVAGVTTGAVLQMFAMLPPVRL